MPFSNDTPNLAPDVSLEEAVFQSLGSASVCWERIATAGIFDSSRAKQIGDELVMWIRNNHHCNHGPYLGMATTEELLAELATRMEITQNSTDGRALGRMCREAIENLDKRVLEYRTKAPVIQVPVMDKELLPWARIGQRRCKARREKNAGLFWGRCELRAGHDCDHALERGMDTPRWSTEWTS